jgi:hypothetical protein
VARPEEALHRLAARQASGELPRYRLQITGTSQRQLRELEAQAGLEGWIVTGTTTRNGRERRGAARVKGISGGWSAVYIATDDPQEEVARAINAALPSVLVNVARLEPIDPAELARQLEALRAARGRFTTGRFLDRGREPEEASA